MQVLKYFVTFFFKNWFLKNLIFRQYLLTPFWRGDCVLHHRIFMSYFIFTLLWFYNIYVLFYDPISQSCLIVYLGGFSVYLTSLSYYIDCEFLISWTWLKFWLADISILFWIYSPPPKKSLQVFAFLGLLFVVFINECACVHAQSLSCVWLFVTPWIIAHQVSLSMEFPRQEY